MSHLFRKTVYDRSVGHLYDDWEASKFADQYQTPVAELVLKEDLVFELRMHIPFKNGEEIGIASHFCPITLADIWQQIDMRIKLCRK